MGFSWCEPRTGRDGGGEEGIASNGADGARRGAHHTGKTIAPPSHSLRKFLGRHCYLEWTLFRPPQIASYGK